MSTGVTASQGVRPRKFSQPTVNSTAKAVTTRAAVKAAAIKDARKHSGGHPERRVRAVRRVGRGPRPPAGEHGEGAVQGQNQGVPAGRNGNQARAGGIARIAKTQALGAASKGLAVGSIQIQMGGQLPIIFSLCHPARAKCSTSSTAVFTTGTVTVSLPPREMSSVYAPGMAAASANSRH